MSKGDSHNLMKISAQRRRSKKQILEEKEQAEVQRLEVEEKLAQFEVTGSSAGGMVQVTLNGKAEARRVKIDPSLVSPDDTEVLEDLIVAAFNDAKAKVEAHMAEKMSELTGGLQLPPGMSLPF